MKTNAKIALALACGLTLGAGGHALIKSTAPPPDSFQTVFDQFDKAMSDQRKAFQSLFAEVEPKPDVQGSFDEQKDKYVITVPIENPSHKIDVKVRDGFVTVTEKGGSKDKNETDKFESVQSFSLDSAYDISKMTQDMNGHTLVITIPKV